MMAAGGGEDFPGKICGGRAVFVPGEIAMFIPALGEVDAVQKRSVTVDQLCPEDLQIEVVVGDGAFGDRIVKFEVQHIGIAFVGHAEGSADGFAKPAA